MRCMQNNVFSYQLGLGWVHLLIEEVKKPPIPGWKEQLKPQYYATFECAYQCCFDRLIVSNIFPIPKLLLLLDNKYTFCIHASFLAFNCSVFISRTYRSSSVLISRTYSNSSVFISRTYSLWGWVQVCSPGPQLLISWIIYYCVSAGSHFYRTVSRFCFFFTCLLHSYL